MQFFALDGFMRDSSVDVTWHDSGITEAWAGCRRYGFMFSPVRSFIPILVRAGLAPLSSLDLVQASEADGRCRYCWLPKASFIWVEKFGFKVQGLQLYQ